MNYKIFKSNITLTYNDKFFETKYKQHRYIHLRKYNIILSSILTVLSIIITILLIFEFPGLKLIFQYYAAAMYCYISCILTVIVTVLSIWLKNNRYQEWLIYINYLMILFLFTNYKFYAGYVLKADYMIYVLIFITEIMFRLAWFVYGCIDFLPGFYLQLITIILNFALYGIIVPRNFFYRFTIHHCILLFTSLLSYLYIREQKRSFYYNLKLETKIEWYKSIIDNMNSGFISINNNEEIQYTNMTLLNFLRNTCDNESQPSSNNNDPPSQENLDINKLFQNIQSDEVKINSFEDAEAVLKGKYNSLEEERFYFIGTKDIQPSPTSCINLEVFGRCTSSNHNQIDRYEFIFNDITRTVEQKNAEFKYKTLYLSKIAHEFKNPLLCICELADQLYEKVTSQGSTENVVSDLLKQIKSMSNYLIILIKDMDFFSQRSSEKIEKRAELDRINLQELLDFCLDIVHALIKKSHKEAINFQFIKDKNLPTFITTDEIKLKQIIVNLLSNSIKYTLNGSIELKVTVEYNRLKFQVDDTGKGIPDDLKAKIFTPFSNEFDKLNKVSSGLGLSIVKELVELLGSKVEFTSTVSKGSSFWFTLQIDENELNTSSVSVVTVPGVHYNELAISSRMITKASQPQYYVIVADDEAVIRQSSIRLLYKTFKEMSFNASIIEASDGLECLYYYYTYVKEGKSISFILSDETMMYLNGCDTASILDKISKGKNIVHVPFFILTAYENLASGVGVVDEVFTKPLRKTNVEQIIKSFCNKVVN
jgi:signal transduction histidine kinase/CheY-like chemotaxis protein